MSQYIYIASPVKLPKGTYGYNPISHDRPNIFNTELDYTHLYFENNYDGIKKNRVSFSSHFSYDYQVSAYANRVPLKHREDGSPIERKCLALLYTYIEQAILNSGIIEYFTCISGEEDKSLSAKRNIHWKDIQGPYDLVLNDLEFWEIKL